MLCPRCGTRNSALSPRDRNWCRKDSVFFCANCVRAPGKAIPQCPLCHSQVVQASNFFVTLLLIVAVLALAGVAFFYPTYQLMSQIQGVPLSPVASTTGGEFVKLSGRISAPPSTVVISGSNAGGYRGGYWSYSFQNFYLIDGSGSIYVDMSGVGTQVFGHGPNGTEHTVVFSTGDSLALAGTVQTNGSGKYLRAARAADTVADLYDPSAGQLAALLAVVGTASAAGFGFSMYQVLHRLRLHREQVAAHPRLYFGDG